MTTKEQFIEDVIASSPFSSKNKIGELFDKYFKESQTGWVSVKERLPEYYGDYLTVNKSNFQHVCYFSMHYWVRKDAYDATGHREVTHWQPLPQSPEK